MLAQIQDVKKIEANIEVFPKSKSIKSSVDVTIDIIQNTNVLYLDSQNLNFESVVSETDTLQYESKNNKLYIKGNFEVGEQLFHINYTATPKQTLYFVDDLGKPEIFTQGQGKYTSHWLPSIDDMTDKIEFDLNITAPKDLTIIANGILDSTTTEKNTKTWYYDMKKPMSSYLVAFAIGDFDKKTLTSTSGVILDFYFEPKDTNEFEPTYRYSKEIFDYLETEIGVPYPWQNYKQVYVKDFLYAGMENTSATIFSDAFVTDDIGFIDRNYVNVNAHELAHQWFGNLVTEKSSAHHWLQEGFATYYALLAERQIFGDDYYYWKLYQSAEELKKLSDEGKGEALTNPKASSLTFYEKGAWALHILREQIGDEAFKNGIKSYLNTYKFQNVTVTNFINEMETVSGQDLSEYRKNWLDQSAFRAEQALQSLQKSAVINQYFEVQKLREIPMEDKEKQFFQLLSDPNLSVYIGQELALQITADLSGIGKSLLRVAMETDDVLIRQTIAENVTDIPVSLQADFESLLDDASYQTKELALFNLWQNFSKKRPQYLDKLKGIPGFSDKNVELLWLTLNLATQDYEPTKKRAVFQRLTTYTSSVYSYQIRENAFNYLYQIEAFSDPSLINLVNATTHHVWRFKKFSRELLKELLKKPDYKKRILQLKATFSKAELDFINSIL